MSGAGRRTIHKETGSGGWPNGLTVDYLEKRILWIDARSDQDTRVQPPQPCPGSYRLLCLCPLCVAVPPTSLPALAASQWLLCCSAVWPLGSEQKPSLCGVCSCL